ncbi:MAG: ChbG/HpnK family deacetylase [Gaiellaceae bacterium]
MRTLIVNADDLGLADGVNAGVLRAHREGIVTSASLMVRQPAARAAAAAASACPDLSVGLHFDLGEWERRDGDWRPRYLWAEDTDAEAIAAELEWQLRAFRKLVGRDPTHLDSHQHVHRDEPARELLVRLANALGIPLRHHSAARYYGGFYGQDREGAPLRAAIAPAALEAFITSLPSGTTELCCHPAERVEPTWAYGIERTIELESLCCPGIRAAVSEAGVQLRSFA